MDEQRIQELAEMSGQSPDVLRKRSAILSVHIDHDPRVVIRFYTKMAHWFGRKWESNYGVAVENGELTDMARLWADDLSHLTSKQIAKGLEVVQASALEWPPGPMDFLQMAQIDEPKDWLSTWSGIVARGKELGIEEKDFVRPPDFKAAVIKAHEAAKASASNS